MIRLLLSFAAAMAILTVGLCPIDAQTRAAAGTLPRKLPAIFANVMAAEPPPETLADVLRKMAISLGPGSIHHLDDPITSYATLNTNQEFVIAYYLFTPGNVLKFPLLLARLDRRSGKWQEASLSDLKLATDEGTKAQSSYDCLGSALSLERNGGRYYLGLHLSPSAQCLVVLDQELNVNQTLPGWVVGFFKSGSIVYEGNMVHFAPVHATTLFFYDPAARKSRHIYPLENDPLRKDFSTRLAKTIDRNRCRENNWACDPDDFDSSLVFSRDPSLRITTNDATRSLAFQIAFDTKGFLPREEAAASGQWNDDRYVYIYQLAPFRWREFRASELKAKFGTDVLKDLLTPEQLSQVFATPSPR